MGRRRSAGDAAALQDSTTLALAAATPHAVLDPLFQGVFQTERRHWAIGADLASPVDADAIAGKEHCRRIVAAVAIGHPGGNGVDFGGVLDTVHRVSFSTATCRSLV